jgi:hypothetical protein
MEQHIRIVAILYMIWGIIGLVIAALVLLGGLGAAGAGIAQEDPDAAIAAGTCFTVIAVIIAVLSVPNLLAGWGLQKRKQWARILTIILSVLNLFQFPLGTALGVYGLWAMLNEQSKGYFV